MNWKMTAKTTLMQLHHKIETFEHIHKKLVVVIQDKLLAYMKREFSFHHLTPALLGDSMHFHSYGLTPRDGVLRIEMADRSSTDGAGISKCLGVQVDAKVELESIVEKIETMLSSETILKLLPS